MTANDLATLVLNDMVSALNNWQLAKLKRTLETVFSQIDVITRKADEAPRASENALLLRAFLSAKRVEGCSARTVSYYESTLSKVLSAMGKHASLVTTDDLREYLHEYPLARGASNATVDNVRRVLSTFFSWLEDEDHIVKSPVRRIRKIRSCRTVKKTYCDEELERLRDHCERERDLAMIDFLSSTGVRVGELVGLDRSHVDMSRRECIVLGKGNKQRVVYFDARTKVHLQQYLDLRDDDCPALFVSLSNPIKRLEISGVESRLRMLGKEAGVSRVHRTSSGGPWRPGNRQGDAHRAGPASARASED